jgi:hypothetical protein
VTLLPHQTQLWEPLLHDRKLGKVLWSGWDLYVTCPIHYKPVSNNFNFTECVSYNLLKCKVKDHALLYTKLLTVLHRKKTHVTFIYTLCKNKSNIRITGTFRNPSPSMFLHLYPIQPTSVFLLLVYTRWNQYLLAGFSFLLGSLLNHADGSHTFLQNAGGLLLNYMLLHPPKKKSSLQIWSKLYQAQRRHYCTYNSVNIMSHICVVP